MRVSDLRRSKNKQIEYGSLSSWLKLDSTTEVLRPTADRDSCICDSPNYPNAPNHTEITAIANILGCEFLETALRFLSSFDALARCCVVLYRGVVVAMSPFVGLQASPEVAYVGSKVDHEGGFPTGVRYTNRYL